MHCVSLVLINLSPFISQLAGQSKAGWPNPHSSYPIYERLRYIMVEQEGQELRALSQKEKVLFKL